MASATSLVSNLSHWRDQSVATACEVYSLLTLFYCLGLYILPYVFGSELWPNQIRSFGTALSQCFHWLFIFGMAYGAPSLLEETNNWGAFLFFASWCFLSLFYVFFLVPEIAGLTIEEIEHLFRGPWFNAYKRSKKPIAIPEGSVDDQVEVGEVTVKE